MPTLSINTDDEWQGLTFLQSLEEAIWEREVAASLVPWDYYPQAVDSSDVNEDAPTFAGAIVAGSIIQDAVGDNVSAPSVNVPLGVGTYGNGPLAWQQRVDEPVTGNATQASSWYGPAFAPSAAFPPMSNLDPCPYGRTTNNPGWWQYQNRKFCQAIAFNSPANWLTRTMRRRRPREIVSLSATKDVYDNPAALGQRAYLLPLFAPSHFAGLSVRSGQLAYLESLKSARTRYAYNGSTWVVDADQDTEPDLIGNDLAAPYAIPSGVIGAINGALGTTASSYKFSAGDYVDTYFWRDLIYRLGALRCTVGHPSIEHRVLYADDRGSEVDTGWLPGTGGLWPLANSSIHSVTKVLFRYTLTLPNHRNVTVRHFTHVLPSRFGVNDGFNPVPTAGFDAGGGIPAIFYGFKDFGDPVRENRWTLVDTQTLSAGDTPRQLVFQWQSEDLPPFASAEGGGGGYEQDWIYVFGHIPTGDIFICEWDFQYTMSGLSPDGGYGGNMGGNFGN